MSIKWRKGFIVGLLVIGSAWLPGRLRADSDVHPTDNGDHFGLGLELGDPGTWGITGKFWIDRGDAFQPALKFNNGGPGILQLDYVMGDGDGMVPFYIGIGANFILESPLSVGARLPLGITYLFDRKRFPLDVYLQFVPTLWLYSGGATLNFYPELGAHFYLF